MKVLLETMKHTFEKARLVYARTVNMFQVSKAPNHLIIVDGGTELEESSSSGLLYSGLSRGTDMES